MTAILEHLSLGCTLQGVHDQDSGIVQFRGIQYGKIFRRFGPAQLADKPAATRPSGVLDCTKFGPRCPQVHVDVGHLLRLPQDVVLPHEAEDEFECLNLDVSAPEAHISSDGNKRRLPVLIWIHGGSQAMTFGSAASKVCDMTRVVSDSARLAEPIIAVGVQYRLNVFAHGDGMEPKNLALLDQALAIDWLVTHIADFGGNPDNMTLAGESAGAVYCHAHLAAGASQGIRQCILMSGSLFLSPPQPSCVIASMRDRVADELLKLDSSFDLDTAPVECVIKAIDRSGIQSWFLEDEERLEGWRNKIHSQRLLVSDVQFESVLWRNGIWGAVADSIVSAFNIVQLNHHQEELKHVYGIHPDRPSSCKLGALDFINDYKFLLPAEIMAGRKPCAATTTDTATSTTASRFRCIIDEPNPWQPSHGAHHAVDLLLLFGGFEALESYAPSARKVGRELRERFVNFVNGGEPCGPAGIAVFGPHGEYQELTGGIEQLLVRRRMTHVDVLRKIDATVLDQVFLELARGRISLLN